MLYIIVFIVSLFVILYFFERRMRSTKNEKIKEEYNKKCVSWIMGVMVAVTISALCIAIPLKSKTEFGKVKTYYDEVFIPNIMNGDSTAEIPIVHKNGKSYFQFTLNGELIHLSIDSCELLPSDTPRVERRFLEKFGHWKNIDEERFNKLRRWFFIGWNYERLFEKYVVYVPKNAKLRMTTVLTDCDGNAEVVTQPVVSYRDTTKFVKSEPMNDESVEEQTATDTL